MSLTLPATTKDKEEAWDLAEGCMVVKVVDHKDITHNSSDSNQDMAQVEMLLKVKMLF